jgi:hypothetical protein
MDQNRFAICELYMRIQLSGKERTGSEGSLTLLGIRSSTTRPEASPRVQCSVLSSCFFYDPYPRKMQGKHGASTMGHWHSVTSGLD